jgi:hypothetical protein
VRRSILVLAILCSAACAAGAVVPKSPDRFTVRFYAHLVPGKDHSFPLVFAASYPGRGSTARFDIALDGFQSIEFLSTGRVTLIAVPGSDAHSFLAALERALDATRMPSTPKRVKRLALDCVILDYSRKTGWIHTKLFFGDDQGEVFLNLNPRTGRGEFSLKDSDYGNYVLAQLARVV